MMVKSISPIAHRETIMTPRRFILSLALAVFAVLPLSAQVKYPPRADKLDLQIHYRIQANRDERIRQFKDLTAHLAKLGFVATPREDADLDILDPNAERFAGTIPGANVLKVLDDPRVLAIQFAPAAFASDDPAKLVPVRIGLTSTTVPARDRKPLHRQTVEQLERLGFREATGYEHHGYTVVRGSLPAENLPRLLRDLRGEPGGWFLPDSPASSLPFPLRGVSPIRWVEVLPDADIVPFAPKPVPPSQAKFTADLRASLTEAKAGPIRVEAILDRPGAEFIAEIRNRLIDRIPGASVEGVVGFVISLTFDKAVDLERFAAEPYVNAVRRPRVGTETIGPLAGETAATTADMLATTRLDKLHELGQKGQGVRVVVIATGFPGVDGLLGKDLPKQVKIIDLTAELSRTITPQPADEANPGQGTALARAVAAAAPNAELVLVRVARDAFFQLETIARFIHGDGSYSDAMQSRIEEISRRSAEIERIKPAVIEEYRKAFAELGDDDKSRTRRDDATKALQTLLDDERGIAAAVRRYSELQNSLKALAGGNVVVVNPLVWEVGFPADGLSDMSRRIDQFFAGETMKSPPTRSATRRHTENAPLWVQAASAAAGSVWGGPFLDGEDNGVMEFAPPYTPLPANRWTHELNFLGTRAADGKVSPTLAANTRLRVTVQWRELHHTDIYIPPDPVFPLTLRVLKQLDPEGEKRASDEMEEVARSAAPIACLMREPGYAVYEQVVEVSVPAEGRYALRVDGGTSYDPRLPALKHDIEVQPLIYAEFVPPAADGNRPVFTTFVPSAGGVGIPGDAKGALTIASIRPAGDTSPQLLGGGPGLVLLPKPDLYEVGTLAGQPGGRGPGIAAGYAAGLSASMVGAGTPTADILRSLQVKPGGTAIIPEEWLKWVQPKP